MLDFKSLKEFATALKIPVDQLSTNLLEKPTKELGEGVGNLFWLAFAPVHFARNYLEPRIEKFKEEIGREISKIPSDQLTEPPLNIVGPALEASKYYIENEVLRLMFARLIASSMDTSRISSSHPSFVEIIKQLSPLDANNFKYLSEHYAHDTKVGVATICMILDEKKSEQQIYPNFFPFPELNRTNSELYASSITNLMRLGLINIDFQRNYLNKLLYQSLHEHSLTEYCKEIYPYEIVLKEGVWDVTEYGKSFINCCF
ncbi:DUF4393 domain-containing protein [Paenibacillus alvei]|uniref:DUF4393 domain-containing protein n=1 Tax=Paenibacillus alvei TaxID=44250 RepID=A0ABT4H5H2_PAEAL|nr:DUF4393 domain-containing protein [Paenibacillus alvei]EJW14412.1 hypothetical protein PAV_13c00310 [Paenibacillus alvei DSM 29]MCY9544765.1 DUF4393 domain-containing protein [Paenibacillus alvei]MCY9708698.1 DUF4393 domain-containing protein [Paenibacillus alvei]MCY9737283.1 DUF4393 domain-containing protein [Paenibacillus alvei]MCY9758129.1 DUF4393 domain-containing protein [Paenibacillus alvei]